MSVDYKAVGWNANKRVYDFWVLGGVAAYLVGFILIGTALRPAENPVSDEILLIRALGSCAILLLHLILVIGPLARLDSRFLPLLYNRRHLGVTMFIIALAHGAFALAWYHGFGPLHPLVSLFAINDDYGSLARFPFQPLGFVALLILAVMATTSHDFWLNRLGPKLWKTLHMGVYFAYALLIGHVMLGVVQTERAALYPILVALGLVVVIGLHLAAGMRGRRQDAGALAAQE